MIQMYFARHGQTEENVNRIFQGQLPGRLTEEGKRQAVAMGEELAGVSLDAVVSSDLQRVVDTVQLAVGNRNLPWEKNSLLREIDWGSWTGRPLDSVDRKHLPSDAETKEMLYERAGRFVEYLRKNYEGKKVLVVAHGLVNRSIQAQILGVPADQGHTETHMKKAEVRYFEIN